MQDVNIIMVMFIFTIVSVALFVRENDAALDQLADWAASRAYGIRCAKAEHQQRKYIREMAELKSCDVRESDV